MTRQTQISAVRPLALLAGERPDGRPKIGVPQRPAPSNDREARISAPSKPSPDMLALGAEAGGVSVEIAWRIYRAMIEAANGQEGRPG